MSKQNDKANLVPRTDLTTQILPVVVVNLAQRETQETIGRVVRVLDGRHGLRGVVLQILPARQSWPSASVSGSHVQRRHSRCPGSLQEKKASEGGRGESEMTEGRQSAESTNEIDGLPVWIV